MGKNMEKQKMFQTTNQKMTLLIFLAQENQLIFLWTESVYQLILAAEIRFGLPSGCD